MKLLFTLMLVCATALMINAQVVFENQEVLADFEGTANPILAAFSGEDPALKPNLEIVANPLKDALNSSSNVFVFGRIDDGNTFSHKSSMTFSFSQTYYPGDQNMIHLKCYSPDRSTCFRFVYYMDDAEVKNDWIQTNVDCNSKWAYLSYKVTDYPPFNKIQIETSDAWGSTASPGVVYIDDIELYNESVSNYLPAFNGMVFNAKETTEPMNIDGIANESVWNNATFSPIENISSGDGSGIGGEWAATWDQDNLYLFMKVTDDQLWLWNDLDWAAWKGDGFQVYLDVLARRIDARTFGNLSGFDITPGRESNEASSAGKDFKSSLGGFGDTYKQLAQQGSTITNSGYTLEVAWPWKGLAVGAGTDLYDPEAWVAEKVKSGLEIAFDLQLNDDDGAGRVNMLSWASAPKEPYGNSGTWGGIKLENATGIKVVEAKNKLVVFPTLASNFVNIQMKGMKNIQLVDVTGKTIVTKSTNSDHLRYDVSFLKKGIYFIKAGDSSSYSVAKIMIK